MASDDDFTFCQVGSPADQSGLEAQKAMPDISGVTLKDESASDANCSQHNGILWKDKVPSNAISKKAATVGSLSFNVIDTSPRGQSTELPKEATPEDTDNSISRPQQQKTPARKPAPRAKVPFEKGYSPMDWLKLTQKHPEPCSLECGTIMSCFMKHQHMEISNSERVSLKFWPYALRIAPWPVKFLMGYGLKGQSNRRLITLNEVKQHQTGDAMWTVLKGRVYNIAPYMKFHPGGVDMLMKAVGKDCTSLFNKYHAWVNAEVLLEKCLVGTLDYTPVKDSHL